MASLGTLAAIRGALQGMNEGIDLYKRGKLEEADRKTAAAREEFSKMLALQGAGMQREQLNLTKRGIAFQEEEARLARQDKSLLAMRKEREEDEAEDDLRKEEPGASTSDYRNWVRGEMEKVTPAFKARMEAKGKVAGAKALVESVPTDKPLSDTDEATAELLGLKTPERRAAEKKRQAVSDETAEFALTAAKTDEERKEVKAVQEKEAHELSMMSADLQIQKARKDLEFMEHPYEKRQVDFLFKTLGDGDVEQAMALAESFEGASKTQLVTMVTALKETVDAEKKRRIAVATDIIDAAQGFSAFDKAKMKADIRVVVETGLKLDLYEKSMDAKQLALEERKATAEGRKTVTEKSWEAIEAILADKDMSPQERTLRLTAYNAAMGQAYGQQMGVNPSVAAGDRAAVLTEQKFGKEMAAQMRRELAEVGLGLRYNAADKRYVKKNLAELEKDAKNLKAYFQSFAEQHGGRLPNEVVGVYAGLMGMNPTDARKDLGVEPWSAPRFVPGGADIFDGGAKETDTQTDNSADTGTSFFGNPTLTNPMQGRVASPTLGRTEPPVGGQSAAPSSTPSASPTTSTTQPRSTLPPLPGGARTFDEAFGKANDARALKELGNWLGQMQSYGMPQDSFDTLFKRINDKLMHLSEPKSFAPGEPTQPFASAPMEMPRMSAGVPPTQKDVSLLRQSSLPMNTRVQIAREKYPQLSREELISMLQDNSTPASFRMG